MVTRKNLLVGYKFLCGLLGLSALITEVVVLVDRGTFDPGNFFSFFTVESNLFAAGMFLVSGIALLRGKQSAGLTMLRGAATVYMATTGIVFALLLSGIDSRLLTAIPWDNTVLHYLIPIAVVLDWLLDPPKRRIPFRRATIWLAYPLAYLPYTLVRGHITGWYPYPFLDPSDKGYLSVAIVCVGVAAVVLAVIWLISRIQRKP